MDTKKAPARRQGDVALLGEPLAHQLLAAAVPARLAYTGLDASPRVIPMNFHWNGDELVMGAFAGTYKVSALSANPDVAVCIDTMDGPPEVLLLRGSVTLEEVDGVLPEYASAQRKMTGGAAEPYLDAIDEPGLRMVRIGLHPTWVGILDFHERLPERTPLPVRRALRPSSTGDDGQP